MTAETETCPKCFGGGSVCLGWEKPNGQPKWSKCDCQQAAKVSEELEAGARAMWEHHRSVSIGFNPSFDGLLDHERARACRAFAAGLEALLLVSDAVVDSMVNAERPNHRPTVADSCRAEFTAAIRHITTPVEGGRDV